MKNEIKKWGLPPILEQRKVDFMFEPNKLLDKINNTKKDCIKNYYRGLHSTDGSVKFCLYDFESNEIVFTMDFFRSHKFSKEKYIKLQVLYVNAIELRKKGIATYYLKKLRDYAEEKEICKIKIYVNPNYKLFENKENTLSKKDLIKFYKKIENDKLFIEIIE
ncbi:Uncharacterised protein [uncultured Clostridium sp.]|uniref:hypothetical protein n=1 Tax=uncultured Clostridium sp. TaxID=59620 RepID=UPI000821B393|nr:hypothetical protein [uncultured Clostridium sp.]SCJ79175.1 Uncharacterised protein [uncultured Clostridium sp.]